MTTQLERLIEAIDELARKELWHCSTGALGGECKARYDALIEAADVIRMHVETEEQSRQRFEAWLSIKCDSATLSWPLNLSRRADGSYRNEWIESHWQAWQASQEFTEASK